ncbi:hypothetical protein EJ07DRAFT_156478 [Lizonia empirigonia]|nr:hypothetical protein EJ07DRAFT_156478 [Lizonia empirigonia]
MYCPTCSPRASVQCVIILDFAEAHPKRLVHPETGQYKRPLPYSGNKLSPAPCASTSPSASPSASRVDTLRLRPRFPLSVAALSLAARASCPTWIPRGRCVVQQGPVGETMPNLSLVPSHRSFACCRRSLASCFFACRLDITDCDCILKKVRATGENSEGVKDGARARPSWEGEADGQGVGQGQRRSCEAEKRLVEGLRAGWLAQKAAGFVARSAKLSPTTQRGGAQPATAAISAWRRSRADRNRKWPTASPKQPGLLRLRARGNDAAWRCATCSSSRSRSRRTS